MAERPKLISYIPRHLRDEVQKTLPDAYLNKYEKELHKIKRLGNADQLPVQPGFKESDLEHTCAMLGMLNELSGRFPYLSQSVNLDDTAYMIAMHDAGEIIVGDGPPFGPLRESPFWVKRKRQEPKMALRLILSEIPDPNTQNRMKHLFHRFERQNPHDREALLTRFLDKAQGTTRTGPQAAFDYRAVGWKKPTPALSSHLEDSTSILVGSALKLHRALPTEAKNEFEQFVVEELSKFKAIGFTVLANRKITEFNLATKQPHSLVTVS